MFELKADFKWQDIINMIKALLEKIFGFVADEEGWKEEEVA